MVLEVEGRGVELGWWSETVSQWNRWVHSTTRIHKAVGFSLEGRMCVHDGGKGQDV